MALLGAASPGHPGIPVQLVGVLGSLDLRMQLVTAVLARANG